MLNRDKVMTNAITDCFRELYKRAQPSADYDALIEGIKNGTVEDTAGNPVYKRYYLSQEDMRYIVDKYREAYGFVETWNSNMDLALEYLRAGGLKDVYVKDSNGIGHREAKKIKPLKNYIGKKHATKVLELLEACKHFYKFDREASQFNVALYLGGSPTCNKQTVLDYWEAQGTPITIEDRIKDQLWYEDYYGENWKEILKEEENG